MRICSATPRQTRAGFNWSTATAARPWRRRPSRSAQRNSVPVRTCGGGVLRDVTKGRFASIAGSLLLWVAVPAFAQQPQPPASTGTPALSTDAATLDRIAGELATAHPLRLAA